MEARHDGLVECLYYYANQIELRANLHNTVILKKGRFGNLDIEDPIK